MHDCHATYRVCAKPEYVVKRIYAERLPIITSHSPHGESSSSNQCGGNVKIAGDSKGSTQSFWLFCNVMAFSITLSFFSVLFSGKAIRSLFVLSICTVHGARISSDAYNFRFYWRKIWKKRPINTERVKNAPVGGEKKSPTEPEDEFMATMECVVWQNVMVRAPLQSWPQKCVLSLWNWRMTPTRLRSTYGQFGMFPQNLNHFQRRLAGARAHFNFIFSVIWGYFYVHAPYRQRPASNDGSCCRNSHGILLSSLIALSM